jgi:long-chain acyl-CoA synthetase
MSLADLLFEGGGEPSDVLVSTGADVRRRGEVQAEAIAVATQLAARGVGPGHVVGVMLPSGADVVAALFGVWRAGAVYLPLNPRLTGDEVGRLVAEVRPAAIVTTLTESGRFAGLPVVVPGAGTDVVGSAASGAGGVGPAPEPAVHDRDIALIQLTSGTTGRPKAVLLRHSGVLELLDGVLSKLRDGRPSAAAEPGRATGGPPAMPNLIPVSLSLWAGLYNVLFALRVGASIVVLDPFTTAGFVEVVRRFAIRSTVLPPAAMTMLADDPDVVDLAPLRYLRSITAPLSPLQARRFRDRFGVAVLNSYGQTEIGGEIIGWNASDSRQWGETKLGSVGRPHDGVRVRAVDEDGVEVAPDGSGELCVRTPAMSAGYADGADLADRLTPDGWFRTGDVGRVDAEGFVWIEGRLSDMINRGGLKVFPSEVAEVIRLSPDVVDAAVVGVPDDRLGEVPWGFVVPRTGAGAGIDADALEALCRSHLAPYKVPVRFEAVDALPRNEIGKLVPDELVARAQR